ncbi:membrane fusion protein (multidrug efflux system) [Beijerinckia sp. GAS462]|nr:membrane fusion protein (multidrug efflux system) [Beijerinckia sp. GAS462]SEB54323.1 membrane fusion protein, multidrug efflux system [Beijerinckia sp. 28-YEA-48]
MYVYIICPNYKTPKNPFLTGAAMCLKANAFRIVSVLTATFMLAACNNAASPPAAPPPPSVSVTEIKPREVPLRFQYAGRVAAFREVEIRARVSGVLKEKSFIEGSTVKAGHVLFRIDPVSFEIEVARAKAQLMEAQAQVSRTQRDAERAKTLYDRQVGTLKTRDDALSAYEQAQAALAGAQAQQRAAEINLGYTTIAAPISGVTSLRILPEGSLVGTGQNDSLLTRISEIEKVYVHFSFPESELTEIRRMIDSGEASGPTGGRLLATIMLSDGTRYEHQGYVDFTDSGVDLQTGTVRGRALVPNPDLKLRPGQFVRISVEGVTRKDSVVIPQAAVMQGPQGQFVYTIDDKSMASVRPVSVGRDVAGGWIIEQGLKSGDRVVTEGVIKVRPGSPVSATIMKADGTDPASKVTR